MTKNSLVFSLSRIKCPLFGLRDRVRAGKQSICRHGFKYDGMDMF